MKKILYYTLIVLSCFSRFSSAQIIEQPELTITFPQKSDTFAVDKLRLSGYTDTSAFVFVNDTPVNLYPQGTFVTRVNLANYMNQIIIRAEKDGKVNNKILSIYRPPRLRESPISPVHIDSQYMKPAHDIWAYNGDLLTVTFKGSPYGTASFHIDGYKKDIPMIELPPEEARGMRGIYRGTVRLSDLQPHKKLDITLKLKGKNGKKKTIQTPGELVILPEDIPLVGRIKSTTYLHAHEASYSPMSRCPPDVYLHIIGRSHRRYKVSLSETRSAYVNIDDVLLLKPGSPVPRASIAAPSLSFDREWIKLTMPIERPLPFVATHQNESARIQVYIFGAHQASHWITFPNHFESIEHLVFSHPEANVFQMDIQLDQDRLWGYKTFYDNDAFHVHIRRPPVIQATNPIAGLTFAIDPGHGGKDDGAVAPSGLKEKEVNLKWATELANILKNNGANVILTRQSDTTMTLAQRLDKAEKANARFFMSLHNNATTASGNPVRARGTSVYYNLPQNKEFSWAIYPHMVDLGLAPYGRIHNVYYVTNTTDFLVALVEGAFMSHPVEEWKLRDEAFVKKMARAVYNGLLDFLRQQ